MFRTVQLTVTGSPDWRSPGMTMSRTSISVGGGSSLTRSEEHTSELQSLMRISYAVLRFKKKKTTSCNTSTTSSLCASTPPKSPSRMTIHSCTEYRHTTHVSQEILSHIQAQASIPLTIAAPEFRQSLAHIKLSKEI